MTDYSKEAVLRLYEIAESIYDQIDGGKVPKMVIPLRTKSNIRFDPKHSVWKMGRPRAPGRRRRPRGR